MGKPNRFSIPYAKPQKGGGKRSEGPIESALGTDDKDIDRFMEDIQWLLDEK